MSNESDHVKRLETALYGFRDALKNIANYGGCMHSEDGAARTADARCTCPICVAKRAITPEACADWRFSSHLEYRRSTHPREYAMIEAWKAYLGRNPDNTMQQIIGEEPSDRDWYVATSVIQWLATNCGMSVLDKAGFSYDWNRKK